LADQLCERFGFLDGQGNKQRSTCLKALRELERAGSFRLPAPLSEKAAKRRAHLHRVVGLSRFLIRPGVGCRNLASHILGVALKRLRIDFEVHYGFRPWLLETFVEPPYAGTCFKAVNWQWIGQTQGRGRQDRDRSREESVKTIYVYVLESAFRETMGLRGALS
ncbi:MAG: Druantia anti-phage system protein DruA, partial [Waddliaceae bacterium]